MANKTNTEINGKKYYKTSLFLGKDENGKNIVKYFYGSGKKEAEDKKERYKEQLKNSIIDYNPSLIQSLKSWLFEIIKPSGIKDSSFERYWDIFNIIKDSDIAMVRIKDLNTMSIQTAINKISKERSSNNAKMAKKLLLRHYKYLIGINAVIKNPVEAVVIPGVEAEKYEDKNYNPFTGEEKIMLLNYMKKHHYTNYLILSLLFSIGARVGEVLGLHEDDVLEDTLTIKRSLRWTKSINDDLSYRYEFQNDTPKNRASIRTLYINEETKDLLKKAKLAKVEKKLKLGPVFLDSPLLFTTDSGLPINSATFRKSFERALKQLKIPHRPVHSIRHTFITECYEKGVDEMTVQEIVGHSKGSNITRMIYTHLRKENKKERMLEAFK